MIEFLLVLMVLVVSLFGVSTYLYLRNRALSKENDELTYSLVQQDEVRELNQEVKEKQEAKREEIDDSIVHRTFFD